MAEEMFNIWVRGNCMLCPKEQAWVIESVPSHEKEKALIDFKPKCAKCGQPANKSMDFFHEPLKGGECGERAS